MVPDGSIYFWMYGQGLRHTPLRDVVSQCAAASKEIREKDFANYWRGWYNHELYHGERDVLSLAGIKPDFLLAEWEDYPEHPYDGCPEVEARWVPCSAEGKPLIRWGSGCMTRTDAWVYPGSASLAENMKGTHAIVIDCDGDHDGLDLDVVECLLPLTRMTHTLSKPKKIREYRDYDAKQERMERLAAFPASFHLTFTVDKVVPTMHFPSAHMDIVGNQRNSIRYRKDKVWNGMQMTPMTHDIWEYLKAYVERRETR